MISDGDELPNPSRVVRFAGFNKMFKDADDNVVGPSVNVFELRPGEAYLSVTWCEYFGGTPPERLRCAVEAIRASRTVGSKACFCVANIHDLNAVCEEFGIAVRHVYHPVDGNPAHAGIYGITPQEGQVLERLAEETWCDFLTKAQADALPLTACVESDGLE